MSITTEPTPPGSLLDRPSDQLPSRSRPELNASDQPVWRPEPRSTWTTLISSAAVIGVLLGGAWNYRKELHARAGGLLPLDGLFEDLQAWQGRRSVPGVQKIVLFGDSVIHMHANLADEISTALLRAGVPHRFMISIDHPGFRPIHYYYLLDDVLAGHPTVAIVELNPRGFTSMWTQYGTSRYESLSRKLSFSRALAIRNGLSSEQLTLLDPPLFRLVDSLGMLLVFDGLRALGTDELRRWGEGFTAALSLREAPPWRRGLIFFSRLEAKQAIDSYDGDYASHPQAAVLKTLLEAFRRARVPVILYVTPVNVERIAELGLTDVLRISAKIEALRLAVGASPNEWLDLHAVVPDSEFADQFEHLKPEGGWRVAQGIAERVRTRARATR